MARSCVFCGGAPVTNEHVWPDWMRRRENIRGARAHRQILERHGQIEDDRGWESRPFKMTVRAVCRECNNGWMADLEANAKALLSPMLDGRGRQLYRGAQRQLAAWALKTALMFDQASAPHSRPFPPEHYRHLLEHKEPPDATWVWLTAYEGALHGMTGLVAVETTMAGQPPANDRNFMARTFSMDTVAFQVVSTTNPGLTGMNITWPERNIHQLWPYEKPFTWHPTPALTDAGLAWFGEKLVRDLIGRAQVFDP